MYQKFYALFIAFIISLTGCAERNPYNEHERQAIKLVQDCLPTAKLVAKYGTMALGENPLKTCLEPVQHLARPLSIQEIENVPTDAIVFNKTWTHVAVGITVLLVLLIGLFVAASGKGGPGTGTGDVFGTLGLVLILFVWIFGAGLVALASYLYALYA